MNARARLRDATRPQHDAVDRIYSGFDLSSASGYGQFLRAHSSCLSAIELALGERAQALLADWPMRSRRDLLAADLAAMGVEPGATMASPSFPDAAAVLGGLYVLEGSRLGAAVLIRRLAPGAPSQFLSDRGEPNAWRSFMATLDQYLIGEESLASAITAAQAVFRSFEIAGRHELERPRAADA